LIVTFLCVVGINAHICMWSPVQINGYSIATPGEDLCYLKEGPCGGVASADPMTTLIGGKDFHVQFQQNLNHFYVPNPGKLVVDFAATADPVEDDFTSLGDAISDYNALNEITQTNFTIKIAVPDVDCEHGVLRLRYVSQNPSENDRGMIFYQCSDVKVVKLDAKSAPLPESSKPVRKSSDNTTYDCCAPSQFSVSGYQVGEGQIPAYKKFYFDGVNQLVRYDVNQGSGVTAKDGTFQMISNFTSGIEYYYNVNANTCGLYGLNYWSDWCYGAINNQVHKQEMPVGSKIADVWGEENSPFTWTSVRGESSCSPVAMSRDDAKESIHYYNMVEGQPDASLFVLPAACQRRMEEMTSEQLKNLKVRTA